MSNQTTEYAFETAIEKSLVEIGGYIKGDPSDFSRELALDKKNFFTFLTATQSKSWKKSVSIHGKQVESKILQRLFKELDNRGCLDVLRNGFTDYGVRYKMAYFKPSSGMNPDSERLYNLNRLTVTRQVKYSVKNENSIDMLLSLNGLPVATVELKNPFTGQTVKNAKKQYKDDRDPRELLFQFKKRALVHFAVDPDEVYMTTRLAEKKTRYLPFNLGCGNGAGNPLNPNGCKTAYLWEYVWAKDSWLDIIGKFLHLQVETYTVDGRTVKKETMIFPRYHQLDVVRKLEANVLETGAGKNYLIQHSAGSGKSNSIAWLSYRLASLHNANDDKIFDSVIIVTDRKILDRQLQDTIYQFEHKQGVVQRIDKDSAQLAQALEAGALIIITTLQKFPFVLDKIEKLPAKKYAVIVDEAHSSQGGDSSTKMKAVLSMSNIEEAVQQEEEKNDFDEDKEDEIRKAMTARGQQANLSFFAFTATPKAKTLAVFGENDPQTNKPVAFHVYCMRQAIEEGFILDVLEHYITYKMYYKVAKQIEDDPQINKKKATQAIARFVSLHPHNIAQKTEIIIEHFRQVIMKKIGGKAKAMVVTASRPHVIRYKKEFDRYLSEKGYSHIKALVAFSKFTDSKTGIDYSESDMNSFPESETTGKFGSSEYQLLLVADKYQTGFDQPLLHTMYVDKKLSGVKAVQTLSRINRIYPGKEDTFILDFANTVEEIYEAFQPYYEKTTLTENVDPNHLYDLKVKLEGFQVIWQSEVDNFCKVYFQPSASYTGMNHAKLNAYIDPAVDRYTILESEEIQDEFKNVLTAFLRLYNFLSQIIPFQDIELEKFYAYGRLLLNKLPKRNLMEKFKLNDEVALEYYRLEKIREEKIELEKDVFGEIKPPTEVGMPKEKEYLASLSEIIDILNERFGTDFTEADRLFFEQIEEELVSDDKLNQQAKSNTIDNFKYGFDDMFLEKLIERMEQNQELFARIMDDKSFADVVKQWMLQKVYKRLNEDKEGS
ncbi:type I restriction endonuclease subunit R [bacterium]|nr:type I restriction endonuclease subunit R [bacterium]